MAKFYIVAKGNPQHIDHTAGPAIRRFQDSTQTEVQIFRWEFSEANPSFPQLESGDIALCMGKAVYKFLASHSVVPKNKSHASTRMRMVPCLNGHAIFTFDPYEGWNDYARRVDIMTDTTLALRAAATGSLDVKYGDYNFVKDYTHIIELLQSYKASGKIMDLSVDLETVGLDEWNPEKWIVSISLTHTAGQADLIYLSKEFQPSRSADPETLERELWEQINLLMNAPNVKVRGANLKYDCRWMRVKWGIQVSRFVFDCILAGSLLDENRSNSLNVLTKIYVPDLGGYDDYLDQKYDKGRMDLVPKEDLLPYAGGDTDATHQVSDKVRADLLQDKELSRFYVNILHPASRAFEELEYGGVLVSKERYKDLEVKLEKELERCQKEANDFFPARLKAKHNWDTALTRAQVITDFMFTPMGLNLKPIDVTAKNKEPSSAKSHLMKFMHIPEVQEFMAIYSDFLGAKKTKSTYVDGFLKHLRSDGRYHGSYILHKSDDGGTNCLPADQLVLTQTGYKPIIDVEVGDSVLSHTGYWSQVTDFIHNGVKPVFEVTMDDGRVLRATENHPLYTINGWITVGDLSSGETVIGYGGAERWKPIPFNPVYEISSWGRCRNRETGNLIKAQPKGSWGHYKYQIGRGNRKRKDGNLKDFAAHRLVAAAFNPGGKGPELRHLDSVAGNNVSPNLRYGTSKENGEDSSQSGRISRRGGSQAKLSEDDITKIFYLSGQGWLQREIAEYFGVSRRLIGMVLKGDRWQEKEVIRHTAEFDSCRVVSIKFCGLEPTFDITVEDTHSFVAQGLVVHNTGRLSCKDPALQTVPKHTKWAKALRACYVAPPGYRCFEVDFSQGELRITACVANEPTMISYYLQGMDLHLVAACNAMGISLEEVLAIKGTDNVIVDSHGIPQTFKSIRQNGKASNFGLIYGMSADGYQVYAEDSYGVKLTSAQSHAQRNAFFDLYPGLLPWHDKYKELARQHGSVRSPLGRVRHLPMINHPLNEIRSREERRAINAPIQSTLSDCTTYSMVQFMKQYGFGTRNPDIHFAMMTHDSISGYVREDKAGEWLAKLVEVMSNLPLQSVFGWNPQVPLVAEAELGDDMSILEEIIV